MTFINKLLSAQKTNESWLCVGLDPLMARMPTPLAGHDRPFAAFAQAIVDATADLVCAYKPNLAFWLAEGSAGLRALEQTIHHIPNRIAIILDGKFGDIGHTAQAYARAAFETLGVDGVTLNPYLGGDAVAPFLRYADRVVFVLARTSNPGASDLQDRTIANGTTPVWEWVARRAARWQEGAPGQVGLVVGATAPGALERLRRQLPDLPFLIPGIGAQEGSLDAAAAYGPTAHGVGPIINASRSIIYASQGSDFAEAARAAARSLRNRINTGRR